MKVDPKILLVNPPIYDFAAYDYWLKPLGLLTIAGMIAHSAELEMFDFLDRADSFYEDKPKYKSGRFGTGRFFSEKIPTPEPLQNIPRHYRRFGASTSKFVEYLETSAQHDYAMIQTVMTYWYPGYKEVIETIRSVSPATKIILGGPYALICPAHAKSLGADFTVDEPGLNNLFNYLKIAPARDLPPRWQVYKRLESASMRLTTGCPFKCTYCSVPSIYGKFATLPIDKKLAELEAIVSLGVKNIAFYDDALLYKSGEVLEPFLKEAVRRKLEVNFHSPNALNARFVTPGIAELMVEAGFKTFCLGFESSSQDFQKHTGSKVCSEELSRAVEYLKAGGAAKSNITAYQILGHPKQSLAGAEESMRYINSLGIKIMLADFSPIPGTPDGEYCRRFVNLDEPLTHNKTAFPIMTLGNEKVNRLKDMARKLNHQIAGVKSTG